MYTVHETETNESGGHKGQRPEEYDQTKYGVDNHFHNKVSESTLILWLFRLRHYIYATLIFVIDF